MAKLSSGAQALFKLCALLVGHREIDSRAKAERHAARTLAAAANSGQTRGTGASCSRGRKLLAASLGVSDLGAISSPLREVEIAQRSPTPRDASAGRSHVYQRAERAEGISLAPGIVPKGQSRRARRPAAHRHQTPQSRLWEAFGEVSRGSIGRTEWSHRPFHTHTGCTCLEGGNGCGRAACGAMPELVANTPLRVW